MLLDCCFQQIKAIADSGARVVVTGGKVGDMALHYCNKYKLLVVRLMSKWDLRRLCKAVRATPLPRIVSTCSCVSSWRGIRDKNSNVQGLIGVKHWIIMNYLPHGTHREYLTAYLLRIILTAFIQCNLRIFDCVQFVYLGYGFGIQAHVQTLLIGSYRKVLS